MKKKCSFLKILCLCLVAYQCTGGLNENTRTLLVTGGHSYDTLEFIEMFESFEGIDFETCEKPEALKKLENAERFDALVFYDMWQEISEEEKKVFLNQFEKGTGMVFLHHSLVAHQEWPMYMELVGGKYNTPSNTQDSSLLSDFRHDIRIHVKVLDPGHPVTEGMTDFEIVDEGYSNITRLPEVQPLLKTDHPDCDSIIGWTHQVKNSKVVYLMGGHDYQAYENESYRRLISNAIRWVAE